jgi:mono/diheme cytochrome c family protein
VRHVNERLAGRRIPKCSYVAVLALLTACRGQPSEQSPIHFWDDMNAQPKYKAQSQNPFFADGRAARPLVQDTVAVGHLDENEAHATGKEGGAYVRYAPVKVDERLLARGEERFNIYCSVCHDRSGSGKGLVVKHGYPLPVDLAGEHARKIPDGEIFDIITHGVRNMPSYAPQITVDDRWAIVTWVRVLQRSQYASPSDVPPGTAIDPEATP